LLTPLRKTEWVVYAIGERLYGPAAGWSRK
jgi:hypothetical protein